MNVVCLEISYFDLKHSHRFMDIYQLTSIVDPLSFVPVDTLNLN